MVIEGGNPLQGKIQVGGAKNAALPIIAACLLAEGWHRLYNVPHLRDVETLKGIMSKLGVEFRRDGNALE